MARTVSKRKAAGKAKTATRRVAKKTATKAAPRRVKAAAPARETTTPARKATTPACKATTPARKATTPARKPAAKAAPKRRLSARAKPQQFTVSHLNEADFKAEGLRPYARYRDLGIAAATNGLCQAHVIRLIPPVTDEVRKRHLHETELQLIYVLKGWMRNEFEGHGEQLMQQGSCWLQPPGIRHTVLDYSDDCEVLEIIVPADFKTVEVT